MVSKATRASSSHNRNTQQRQQHNARARGQQSEHYVAVAIEVEEGEIKRVLISWSFPVFSRYCCLRCDSMVYSTTSCCRKRSWV